MIKKVQKLKKPNSPTEADYVRGNQEVIIKKLQDVAEYRKWVFRTLKEQFGTDDAEELVIILAEKYQRPIKLYQQTGRKLKWTRQIESMLAVILDSRLQEDHPPTLEDEISWLLSFKCWDDFLQKDNHQELSNPIETIRKRREQGLKNAEYQTEMTLFKEDQKAWVAKMVKVLKG